MAYTTINKSTLHFNTKTYAGNGGSSTDSITGINFQPDWVWIKARNNAYNHNLYDVVRGLSSGAILSNTTAAQDSTQRISSFDSDGFTLPATNYTYVNASGTNYVAWNWKAGNSQGSSNTDGSINTTYTSANTTSGFSISTYTGTGSNATIGHGLGAIPQVVICKRLNSTGGWISYFKEVGEARYLYLDTTDAYATNSTVWNDTAPTSSVFSVGTASNCNASGGTYVAYCFAEKKGYSKFGSYSGNGNADGPFIYTGFKPAWFMWKRSSSSGGWYISDAKRDPFNEVDVVSSANDNDTESAQGTSFDHDFLSNGIKIKNSVAAANSDGETFIYMAFAEAPLVGTNNTPCTAR